jgi:hypothetical protein
MAGDQIVKRILPVLMALLASSCSSVENGSARKGQPAPTDERYNQALEYYTLTHEQDPSRPTDRPREKAYSQIDKETAKRLLALQEALKAWREEKPDTRVAAKDRKEVAQIVEGVFQDPASRARMVVKTYDLTVCDRVTQQFHNKNRCFANVMFFDRGPRMRAGVDLYLFKHQGRWEIVYRTDWIG